MKRILTFALVLGYAAATAQKTDNVGIGTTKPDPSAILDLNTTNKGFLMPRMTETERNAIKNPAMALKVYQIDGEKGEYTFDGTTWQPSARVGATNSVGAWDKQGNAIDGTDFLGSNNAFPLVLKVEGVRVGRLTSDNTTFIGSDAGVNNSTVGVHNAAFGFRALRLNTSGQRNIAMGSQALMKNNASDNLAIGMDAMRENTDGNNNVGVGFSALQANTSGDYNTGLGAGALLGNLTGDNNIGIGYLSGYYNQLGSGNIGIGAYTFFASTGVNISDNLAIGFEAGRNLTGSGNVLIGRGAAKNETNISNQLYISNSEVNNPLIKGNFASNWLKINSKSTGYLAVGDFDAGTPMPTPAGYRLIVQDGILTEKLKVSLRSDAINWADYVFEPNYKLMPLEEIEKYTKENKHLPNVPSADEITKEGIDVAKVSKMFMEKIEELTLHIIELNKRIKELENKKK